MANAATTAPLKEKGAKKEYELENSYLEQQFDPNKNYVFELAEQNIERELPVINMRTHRPEPHKKYRPYTNLVFTSQIVWEGQRRGIRYYDGCTSIFIDEQPKDKDTIELAIKQTAPRAFIDGKFTCYGEERMLLLYLFICSWNSESPFRTRKANGVFKPLNADKIATQETEKLDLIEKAMALAKSAAHDEMLIHAEFLEIPVIDYESGNDLTQIEIRAAYRRYASMKPEKFISSFGDKTLKIRFFIRKAIRTGLIKTHVLPNKATWGKNDTVIMDLGGVKSPEGIEEKLVEYSQLTEGEEFALQLMALFS